ncbi:hypothetical protein DFH07DRAFT_820076 [Mycena maculata]|uniref:Uncharacterized protein n=1 Tax=Mycena maculata TaxID=230809 RepID=A0AAD7NE38_9AGAR|nr:hypothetical protein DFH07DRAFT_820076 [Mycena maculata]
MAVDVLTQNQKLFDTFKDRFSMPTENFDPKRYTSASKRFGGWLGSEKAYYQAARPEIVDILSIAERTLHQVALQEPTHYAKLADAYTRLIAQVKPFHKSFLEQDLHAMVGKLIAGAEAVQNPPPTVPLTPGTNVDPPPRPRIDASEQMRPSSSSLASALTPTSTSRASDVPPPSSLTSGTTSVPEVQPGPAVPRPASAGAASGSGFTSAPPDSTSTKLKRKKKKKNHLSDAIQLDLQLRKNKTGIAQNSSADAQTPTTPTVLLRIPGAPAPSAFHENASMASPRTAVDIDISPSASPVDLSEHNTPSGPQITPAANAPHRALAHSALADVAMSGQEQSKDAEMNDSHAQLVLHASKIEPPSAVLTPAMDVEVNRVLRTLTEPGPTIRTIASTPSNNTNRTTDVAVTDVVVPSASDEAMSLAPHNTDLSSPSLPHVDPSRLTPEAMDTNVTSMEGTSDSAAGADPGVPDASQERERNDLVANPQPDDAAALQELIQHMVNDVNRLIASSTDTSGPVEELLTPPPEESWPTETSSELPPHLPGSNGIYLEDITPSPKTGILSATIIARCEVTIDTMPIKFHVDQNQMDAIKKWRDRTKHSEDLEKSLCITLLCFSSAETKEARDASIPVLPALLPELECAWPQTGGVSMNVLWDGKRIDIPMAPPFALPLNGLVDVSPFLVLGENIFHIREMRSMSKHWVVLCAHHPTTSQLNSVARRRYKERNWTDWLDKLSQPMQLPFRIPMQV